MKLILWWSFASLLQVSDQQSKVCIGIPQQQKTLQTMLLFAACMPGLSGHDWCSFFMFLYDTVSLCYNSNSLICTYVFKYVAIKRDNNGWIIYLGIVEGLDSIFKIFHVLQNRLDFWTKQAERTSACLFCF